MIHVHVYLQLLDQLVGYILGLDELLGENLHSACEPSQFVLHNEHFPIHPFPQPLALNEVTQLGILMDLGILGLIR